MLKEILKWLGRNQLYYQQENDLILKSHIVSLKNRFIFQPFYEIKTERN